MRKALEGEANKHRVASPSSGCIDEQEVIAEELLLPGMSRSETPAGSLEGRQIARQTLERVIERGSEAIEVAKQYRVINNPISRLYFNTLKTIVSPATSFSQDQWTTYGDPLLTQLDQRLDRAFGAGDRSGSNSESELQEKNDGRELAADSDDPVTGRMDFDEEEEESQAEAAREGSYSGMIDTTQQTVYALYWNGLKEKFVSSKWYLRVDDILMQNNFVSLVTNRLRPASAFYNTVTEEFMANDDIGSYLAALKARIGPAWDERLVPFAKAFFTTATTVQSVAGAGKFVGGALQLGRMQVTPRSVVQGAIDELLQRWDQVLNLADGALDRWLPDSPNSATTSMSRSIGDDGSMSAQHPEKLGGNHDVEDEEDEDAWLDSLPEPADGQMMVGSEREEGPHSESPSPVSSPVVDSVLHPPASPPSASKRKRQFATATAGSLAQKCGKRIRQRIPRIHELRTVLRSRMEAEQAAWFGKVDEILLQNALCAVLANMVRPAEHFFNTCVQVLPQEEESSSSSDDEEEKAAFLQRVSAKLGGSWDQRLIQPAVDFYRMARNLGTRSAKSAEEAEKPQVEQVPK